MRYINQQIPNSNSLKFEDLAEVIMPLTCGGDTPIGTNLKTKVLEPLVYNKLPNNLKRPVLVFIITDGMPEPEPKSTFVDTIVECGNRLEEANFPRESEFSHVPIFTALLGLY
jgi:Mg-chelatase subunit ChlD